MCTIVQWDECLEWKFSMFPRFRSIWLRLLIQCNVAMDGGWTVTEVMEYGSLEGGVDGDRRVGCQLLHRRIAIGSAFRWKRSGMVFFVWGFWRV